MNAQLSSPLLFPNPLHERYQRILQRMAGQIPKPLALEVVHRHYRERHSGEEMPEAEALARYRSIFNLPPETAD